MSKICVTLNNIFCSKVFEVRQQIINCNLIIASTYMPASTIMEIKVGEKVRRNCDLSTPNAKLIRVMLPEAMSDDPTLIL